MLVARKGLPGHVVYGRVRNATELLESLDLLDPETRSEALPKLREKQWTAHGLAKLGAFSSEQLLAAGFGEAETQSALEEAAAAIGRARAPDVEQLKKDLELARAIVAAADDDMFDAQQQRLSAIAVHEESVRASQAAKTEVTRLIALANQHQAGPVDANAVQRSQSTRWIWSTTLESKRWSSRRALPVGAGSRVTPIREPAAMVVEEAPEGTIEA